MRTHYRDSKGRFSTEAKYKAQFKPLILTQREKDVQKEHEDRIKEMVVNDPEYITSKTIDKFGIMAIIMLFVWGLLVLFALHINNVI